MCAATPASPSSRETRRRAARSQVRRVLAEGVEAHGGVLIEVRGDEGLAVFTSARQAIRAAVDLQARFAEETEADPSCR